MGNKETRTTDDNELQCILESILKSGRGCRQTGVKKKKDPENTCCRNLKKLKRQHKGHTQMTVLSAHMSHSAGRLNLPFKGLVQEKQKEASAVALEHVSLCTNIYIIYRYVNILSVSPPLHQGEALSHRIPLTTVSNSKNWCVLLWDFVEQELILLKQQSHTHTHTQTDKATTLVL